MVSLDISQRILPYTMVFRFAHEQRDWLIFGTITFLVSLLLSRLDAWWLLTFFILPVGIATLILTFLYIDWGFAAFLFIMYTNAAEIAIEHGLPSPTKIYGAVLLMATALRWIRGERFSGVMRPVLVILAYLLLIYLSLLYSDNYRDAKVLVVNYIREATVAIIAVLIIRTGSAFRISVWSLLLGGLFLGSMNFLQFATSAYWFDFGGFANAGYDEFGEQTGDFRISGPLIDPNFYGLILLPLIPLAIERLMHERHLIFRILAAVSGLFVLLAIGLTYSRGALVGLLGMLILILVRIRFPIRFIVYAMIFGLILLPLLPSSLTYRISDTIASISGENTSTEKGAGALSVEGRMAEMRIAVEMFIDNPISGVGAGNYVSNFQRYSQELHFMNRGEDRNAHSLYLQIAAERGFIGLLSLSILLFLILKSLKLSILLFNSAKCDHYAHLATALGIGFFGFLVSSTFLHDSYPKYFWLLVGLALALPQAAQSEIDHRNSVGTRA